MDPFFHLEFDSSSENEAFARAVVCAFAARLDPTLQELEDIRTAVSEAVTNAIIHGYDQQPGTIWMRGCLHDRLLTVSVEDHGVGMEDVPKAMEALYTSRPDLERSGLGFTLMQSFMDSVEVASVPGGGTIVTMRKKILPPSQDLTDGER